VELPAGRLSALRRRAEAQAAAARELLLHSIAAFVLIVLLLALAFGSARHVLLVLFALPSTLIGGVAAVALTGGTLTLGRHGGLRRAVRHGRAQYHLAGLALRSPGARKAQTVESRGRRLRGAEERLTPVLLTALLTGLALLPVALQLHQPGHEIEGPMAVVILGGLVSSTLVSLLLIPPLAARWLENNQCDCLVDDRISRRAIPSRRRPSCMSARPSRSMRPPTRSGRRWRASIRLEYLASGRREG
jgi:Cu/Ag efflux pump CusA